jgi:hypothetical protein
MDREQAETRWRRAVANYQRREGAEALRAMVREMEPPEPPQSPVDPEAALWFRTLAPPPLDGLDHFTRKLVHGEAAMERQDAWKVLSWIGESKTGSTQGDYRIAVNGRRLSPAQCRVVEQALTMFIETKDKEERNEPGREIRGNGDALRRPGDGVVNAG